MKLTLTANGSTVFQCSKGSQISAAISGTFDGASVAIGYAVTEPVAALLDVDDAVETPGFTITAKDAGVSGNSYSVAFLAATSGLSLGVTQNGLTFNITLATDAGDVAAVTTAMVGADNDITILAGTAGTIGNGYSVELLAGSGATQALTVSTVDYLKFSVLLGRTANAISSTAAQVVAALNAYAPFSNLMLAAVKDGDAGTGIVTALAETDLTGGGANFAITSTSADVVELINTNPIFAPHISAAVTTDGSDLMAALAETPLAGGTQGTFVAAETVTAAGIKTVRNVGVSNFMAATVTSAGGTTSVITIINGVN